MTTIGTDDTFKGGLIHGPLLLDRSVCLPLFAMWPSFGYFSTLQPVQILRFFLCMEFLIDLLTYPY